MKQLIAHAAQLGYNVHVWDLGSETAGLTDIAERSISLNLTLTIPEQRSTLAHECGHAFYGHDCTDPVGERQARKYAATLLIEPAEYARLERINPDQHWLADEFTVTPRIIFDYETFCLTRLRGVTYSQARMGLGQWSHRLEVI
ncbi:Zn-dependent peptidase ImmA (M78 family) [Microbacterium resistens]|uniref:Zn-dependent peptidase ImmA (M78 family) n=1 Tax=Microbacterium resistens TaxID=156977 RepID=A0ABU1SDG0_9MICO|nr:ImmA/IrrE family metallo-endopeptidase [Microbacterium resistens]MDR6867640.1 Zn-dependent peptidase ImmA (M78 family) [Microbacterium resistens]